MQIWRNLYKFNNYCFWNIFLKRSCKRVRVYWRKLNLLTIYFKPLEKQNFQRLFHFYFTNWFCGFIIFFGILMLLAFLRDVLNILRLFGGWYEEISLWLFGFFMSFCLAMEGWCDNIILVKSLFCWFYQCVSICLVSRYRFYIFD